MENEVVETKKKSNVGLIVLLIIIILGLASYIIYDKYFKVELDNCGRTENNNEEVKKELYSIDDKTKKELLDLIGLTEKGLERMDKSEVIDDQLDSNYEWIDISNVKNSLFWVIRSDEDGTYTVNDLSVNGKKFIILESVLSKGKLVDIDAGDDETHPCFAGSGHCDGVSEELYKTIATRYGFSQNPLTVFDSKYEGYYLINFGGSILNPHKIEDKLSYDIRKEEVDIIYDVKLVPYSMNYADNKSINQTITYTFKLVDGQYNLLTFKVVNK